ncbi:MAG TPA: hypothetical protein VFK11_00140 [Candidatus Saccharimonadales bacterium]|nr:hypothetical protein [Candidatus Saccharimonadales bacterium]
MKFFDRFSGGKDKDEESDDLSIYKDEPARSKVASVLFGLFALLVTILIASALFFGGRAIYRALNGDSNDNQPSTAKTDDSKKEAENKKKQSGNQAGGEGTSNSQTGGGSTSTPSTGDNATAPSTTPSTGDTLPDTGDPGL